MGPPSAVFSIVQPLQYRANVTSIQNTQTVDVVVLPVPTHSTADIHYEMALTPTFWDKRPISVYQAFAQHRARTTDSCNNTCDPTEPHCNAMNATAWEDLNKEGRMPFTPFLSRGQYVFDWEKHLLSYPPLFDYKTLPDKSLSKVVMENVHNGTVTCKMFGYLRGRVDLVDGYGRRRTRGDDEVRVWVKSADVQGYASSGDVTDLKNGSYSFTIRCLWPGNSSLYIALSYPREFLRVAVHQIHLGVSRMTRATFANEDMKEVSFNRLTCDDWVDTGTLYLPLPLDVTEAENDLIRNSTGYAPRTLLKHNLKILTLSTGNPLNLPLCYKSNTTATWNMSRPKGFWSPGLVWNSLVCKQKQDVTREWAQQCLQNTTVWIIGDSNGNRTYTGFLNITGCNDTSGGWPRSSRCQIKNLGFKINAMSHEKPQFANLMRAHHIGSVPDVIDNITSTGKHIVFVHYYLHYIPAHMSVLYLRMKALREAVERLLKRNPNVLCVVRGPHITTVDWSANHAVGGDTLAPRFVDVIKDRFRGLEHKVLYLDGWDMTVSIENAKFHPPIELTRETVNTILSYICQ
ncbi:NXPE family member 2-like [Physella acuta]|uniref:NXPE family member 2-like n=1 Tax=Physella acuta TaxID=109671 RepID=UPI0027DC44A8|nr:NXPE family member 2-like [Physella acuta]